MTETLEEVAERAYLCGLFSTKTAFIAGVNWQTKRMYSEEDMKSAFECAREFDSLDGIVDIDVILAYKADTSDLQAKYITFEEWFEQFKKK